MVNVVATRPGQAAENFVAAQLQSCGWQILARNKRTPYAEVDMFALPPPIGSALVLVEVKARHPLSWAQHELSLGWKQRRRLARALIYEANRLRWGGEIRADLAFVELQAGLPKAWELVEGIDLLD
jgi:Holliday junction resolvase-like predicted endonuclease